MQCLFYVAELLVVQNHFLMVKGNGFALQIFLKQRVWLNLEIQVWILQPSTENHNVFSLGVPVLLLGGFLHWFEGAQLSTVGCAVLD